MTIQCGGSKLFFVFFFTLFSMMLNPILEVHPWLLTYLLLLVDPSSLLTIMSRPSPHSFLAPYVPITFSFVILEKLDDMILVWKQVEHALKRHYLPFLCESSHSYELSARRLQPRFHQSGIHKL